MQDKPEPQTPQEARTALEERGFYQAFELLAESVCGENRVAYKSLLMLARRIYEQGQKDGMELPERLGSGEAE